MERRAAETRENKRAGDARRKASADGKAGGRPSERDAIRQEYERRMAEAKASGKRLLAKNLVADLCTHFNVSKETVYAANRPRTK
jgi:hypothetical protein